MDGKQTWGVRSANEMTNSTSRKSLEKTPSPAESEATLSAHFASCNLDVPSALPFHAIFENSEGPLEYHGGEGRDFTIEEIVELGDDSLGLKVLLTAKQGPCLGVINIILTACKKITLEKVLNDVVRDMYRVLRRLEASDPDPVVRLHAQLALQEVDSIMRRFLLPSTGLTKRIYVMDPPPSAL